MYVQLNSTFLFQVIHFWIAYCIVRFIILKPAVTLIMAKEQKNQAMREAIGYTYTLITREKETLNNHWLEGNALHKEKIPLVVDKSMIDKDVLAAVFDAYPVISDEVVLELVETTTEKLTHKLAYAQWQLQDKENRQVK